MQYRQLGRSGLQVSTLTLGTMTFGGTGPFQQVGNTDVKGAGRQLDLCIDAGVNLVDTADIYSRGLSEEILGEALDHGHRRHKLLVASKVRFRMGKRANDAGLSRHHIVAAAEASLKRLRTGHIDLYQLHEWDGLTPLEETLEAMDTLVRHGKVRYVGVSNYSAWHLMKALGVARAERFIVPVAQQIHYTLQAREAEFELVPATLDQGLGILVWSPLAGGLLSGKYRRGQDAPEGSRRLAGWTEPPVRDEAKLYDIVDVLLQVAEAHQVSAAQVALAWVLGRPGVTSAIIGARTEAQLEDNLKSAELTLSEAERDSLDKVSAPPLLYPYWHQAQTAADRLGPADLSLLGPYLS